MKKKIIIFLILVLGIQGLIAQVKRPPIQPLNENGYSLNEFLSFSKKKGTLPESYRESLLSMVNNFIKEVGLSYEELTESHLDWLFHPSRMKSEFRIYNNGYWNTRQGVDGKLEWFFDTKPFRGAIMVLHLGGYKLDIGKEVCMNLVRVPFTKSIVEGQKIPQQVIQTTPTEETKRLTAYEDDFGRRDISSRSTSPEIIYLQQEDETQYKKIVDWLLVGKIAGVTVSVAGITAAAIHFFGGKKKSGPAGVPGHNDPGGPGGAPGHGP
jgi:hypothetical protein